MSTTTSTRTRRTGTPGKSAGKTTDDRGNPYQQGDPMNTSTSTRRAGTPGKSAGKTTDDRENPYQQGDPMNTTTNTRRAGTPVKPAGKAPVNDEARSYQQLRAHLDYLKLADAADALPAVLDTARTEGVSLIGALERLLGIEVDAAEQRRLTARLRFACLPHPWRITDYDFSAQPGVDEPLIRDLATLRFLEDASNVLFVGQPGVGKTMLAIALARAAVEAGHRVYFTTAADLAARCHKAAIEGRWATVMHFFAGPRLLVIDEWGYLPLSADGASALFQVINARYLKSSTILTTNVGVADWASAFGDATVAAAMLDRLLHRAAVVGIDGPSYRMRQHRAAAATLRAAVNSHA